MMNNGIYRHARRTAARMAIGGMAAIMTFGISACSGIFEVNDKDAVTAEQLASGGTSVAPALLTGVIQNFANAYDFVIQDVGVYSDELTSIHPVIWGQYQTADSLGTQDLTSTSNQTGNIAEPHWNTLQATRVLAEKLYNILASANKGSDPIAGQALVYSAMSYMFLGELTCDVAFDGGPAQQPVTALNKADSLLTQALPIVTAANLNSGTKDYVSLVHLMRARVLMDLGKLDAAATEAALVRPGFTWLTYPVVPGGQSWVWFHTHAAAFPAAVVGPAFRNSTDPRVPVAATTYQGNNSWDQNKYPNPDSPKILGNYAEALLIQTEAELSKGNVGRAMSFIAQERALTPGLAPLPSSPTLAEATTYLRSERANALFLQGRRLIDLQRWGQQPPEYFGTTPFAKVCIPIPQTEMNNNHNLGAVHNTRDVITFTAP